ncbi:hypothetical protein M2171_002437 [Bradyrhizobium japonicum USDA 38]|uniref:hypothetical protein n=1 Tax=Bradyrhizobium japonicum TaxID=375 RepID=UPI0012BC746C|nr:hypothetical protein [Bradyrhizobium japonicum]MCS3893304.1 hypothetical protein [Bradyrhizobium japonicum USDA 38]MCS3945818.1 hypothetical protein [Bradyrhizobium japonicum]
MALGFELNLLRDGSLRDLSPESLSRVAAVVNDEDAVTAMAWKLLALRPTDACDMIQFVVADAVAILSTTDGDVTEALARLRVWDVVALGKFTGDDLFKLAAKYWRSELEYIVGRLDDQNRCTSGAPACVELLGCERWDEAFMWLAKETQRQRESEKCCVYACRFGGRLPQANGTTTRVRFSRSARTWSTKARSMPDTRKATKTRSKPMSSNSRIRRPARPSS